MIHLDYLANVPLNADANALLYETYQNPNTLNSAFNEMFMQDSKALAQLFYKTHTQSFDYSSGDFLALFSVLYAHNYHICLAPSLHQQSFYAGELFSTLFPKGISSLSITKEGIIESVDSIIAANAPKSADTPKNLAKTMDNPTKLAFFLPIINQDILSINPIKELVAHILNAYPHALIFIDISLFLSAFDDVTLLKDFSHAQVLFLCNAEYIGLMRPSGFIVSDFNALLETHKQALQAFFDTRLLRPRLFKAAHKALQDRFATQNQPDSKAEFFDALKKRLKDNISLFVPLEITAPNALALRFKGIKARLLVQALSVEGYATINGQDCLFGNAKPSFVLRAMGYDDASTRELISLSYTHLDSIESTAHTLSNAYEQLRQFHI
ncbi:cysteine desulfurase [Helicobacter jaachi]|uniref:Cysteine desulfurase n=1 Tax=Helicobacter jaachi TaxID=1677920 RepID=A0A4U8TB35_9HELI|nr:cysteine desulfurase [Helicobacter jaachi]TLD96894.1 cysteine desulfurase [Helicobacter jaachi]